MRYHGSRVDALTGRRSAAGALGIAPLVAVLVLAAPRVARGQRSGPQADDPRAAFDERRSHGVGIFLTGRQLEQGQKRTLGDLLRRVPGMPAPRTAADDGQGGSAQGTPWAAMTPSYAASNARGRYGSQFSALNGCPVVFYLNGMRVNGGTDVAPAEVADLYALPTESLAAVEVYRGPSEIPLELSGADARCAVVGLWTQPTS